MKFLKLLLMPFAFLVVGIVRLLARFGILIRFGELWSSRVGHMVGNSEVYLCERDAGMHKAIDIWTHNGTISNRYLARKLAECMTIDPTCFIHLVIVANRLFDGHERYIVPTGNIDRDIHNLFEQYRPHLRIRHREEVRGYELLRSLGIPEGGKWVCLVVRDSAYLPDMPHNDYRDCDIDNYALAARTLAQTGCYVIRMGAKVHKPFKVNHPRVIDYATSGKRSEFGDFYLGAKCAFCLTSGTGIDAVPYVFRRPMCYTNFVPVEYLSTYAQNSLAIWKHHIKDGKRMPPAEIWDSKAGQFFQAQEYSDAGITLQENTPEEIRDVAMEMFEAIIIGMFVNYQQEEFWRTFPRSISPYTGKPIHGEIRMRIGRKFLKGYL